MSTVSESQPWWAMVSAEKLLAIASHPLTAAPPDSQICLSLFARIGSSSLGVLGVFGGPAGFRPGGCQASWSNLNAGSAARLSFSDCPHLLETML